MPTSRRLVIDVCGVAIFLAVVAALSLRLQENLSTSSRIAAGQFGLLDFRDAVYFPTRAVADGVNPYDSSLNAGPECYMQRYPVKNHFPLYSPMLFVVTAPLLLLSFDSALVVYGAWNAALFAVLAWVTLKTVGKPPHVARVTTLAAALLVSQPGRATFNSGQISLPLALFTIGALGWAARRPWLSALCVALTTIKPTFGGPLGILLFTRRNWRPAIGGAILGGAVFIGGIATIFARSGELSFERVQETLTGNQDHFSQHQDVSPLTNRSRVDLAAAVEYLIGQPLPGGVGLGITLGVLLLTGATLWRASRALPEDDCAASVTSALIIVTMFICIYHAIYELLLLIVPMAGCYTANHPSWQRVREGWRWTIFALLTLPFVNVLWTGSFRALFSQGWANHNEWLFRFASALNGLALTVAWLMLVAIIKRLRVSEIVK